MTATACWVATAADAVEAALRRAGYTAERQDKTAGLASIRSLIVTRPSCRLFRKLDAVAVLTGPSLSAP
jgi:hypothetical protein